MGQVGASAGTGAAIGSVGGPIGAGIGAVVGAGAGYLASRQAKKGSRGFTSQASAYEDLSRQARLSALAKEEEILNAYEKSISPYLSELDVVGPTGADIQTYEDLMKAEDRSAAAGGYLESGLRERARGEARNRFALIVGQRRLGNLGTKASLLGTLNALRAGIKSRYGEAEAESYRNLGQIQAGGILRQGQISSNLYSQLGETAGELPLTIAQIRRINAQQKYLESITPKKSEYSYMEPGVQGPPEPDRPWLKVDEYGNPISA